MAIGVDHSFNQKWPSYWGDKTSTLDWCEENYLYSQYVAEFWNATSNFFFMFIALKGGYEAYKANLPSRFVMLYVWVFIVGLGSLLFHATLKYYMQLLDEIPMIFMACQILHCIMYPNMKEDHDNAPWYIKSSLPLHALAVAVSASYVVIGNPIFHEICFAAILVACVAQYSKFTSQNLAGHADEKVIRHKTQRMVLRAILLMIGAFGIWNIDNVACGKLRSARNSLFGPFVILSPFLQFHALWHVLTIAAADYTVAGIVYIWCQVDFIKTREDLNEIVNGNVQLSPLTNFDQYNYDGLQPLHYAIKGRKAFAVEWLLSHENIPLNSLTENENWNSAHCAVIVGDWETLNKLIQAGANLNSVDSYLLTPLAYAKSDLNAEIWLQYLDEINPINFDIRLGPLKRNYFHYFARDSTKVLLNYVIKMNIDEINYADVTGTTPLMLAAETGQNESLWILLSNGALLNCIDSEGRSALHRAAAFGQSKACQLLLYDSEVIPTDQIIDNNEFTEIYDFSTRADEAQELLLAQDNSDLTPLMTAIISGNIETVRILAKYNSNHLDLKQRHKGETALHLAVSVNSAEMVSILLEAGAYPDALNNFGKKPSDLCATDSDIFDLLAII